MEVNSIATLKLAEELRIPVQPKLRMKPTLEEDSAAAELDRLFYLRKDFLVGKDVAPVLAG